MCFFLSDMNQEIEKVPSGVPAQCDMVISSPFMTLFVMKKNSFQFKKSIWERCPCQQSQANCTQAIDSFLTIHRWFDNKFYSNALEDWPYTQVKYVCDACSTVEYRHFHNSHLQRCLRSQTLYSNRKKLQSTEGL